MWLMRSQQNIQRFPRTEARKDMTNVLIEVHLRKEIQSLLAIYAKGVAPEGFDLIGRAIFTVSLIWSCLQDDKL